MDFLAGLHQLLRPVLGSVAQLPGVQRHALEAALGAETAKAPPERFMIALAVLNLIADTAAAASVLIVADDVQWLDQPTQEVLAFVARRIGADPVVLIGAARSGHDVPLAEAGLTELRLSELDDDDSRTLLLANASDLSGADRERIITRARGNPLALMELPVAIRQAPGEGQTYLPLTARLECAFTARLPDLAAPARDSLLVAAMDSADDLHEILAGAGLLAGHDIGVGDLEPAVAIGLVQVDDRHVRFRHPLVRSAVIRAESPARRRTANLALARVLSDDPYRRIRHRAQAITGLDDEVADELEASHETSLRRGSVTEAIWALERSAELTSDLARRGRRLLLAAEHAFSLGQAPLLDQLLGQAARLPLSTVDKARMVWLREIFHDGVPGDPARVFELCEMADQSTAVGDSELALNLLLGAALRCWWSDTGPAARTRVVETVGARDDPRHLAVLAVTDPLRQGSRVIERLRAVMLETVEDPVDLWLLGMAAHAVGEPECAVDSLARAESKLRDDGRLSLLSQVLTLQVLDNVELGDWGKAEAALVEGRQLALETGQSIWDIGTQTLTAIMAALRGDSTVAHLVAVEAELAAGGRRLNDLLSCVQLAKGIGFTTGGNSSAAYMALRRMFDPDDAAFHSTERFHGVMFLAEAAARAGTVTDARTVIAGLEADAMATTSSTLAKHLSYARAVLADNDQAEDLYRTALTQDLTRWPWLRARIELAYGSWLRRQRQVPRARGYLRSAYGTFELMGAGSWARQASAELRAAGDRVIPAAPATLSALSAQELQIALLAAEGLSNKEIGQRLYLSPRTVASHLYHVFPKLGVASRADLAARLADRVPLK